MAYTLTWRPSYLKRRILAVFIVVFLLTIVGLEVLYQYSLKHNGFVSSDEGLHYLWTYGPTAIFTLLAASWSRIEYQIKQNAPWMRMSRGPGRADRTVFLDYVSPIQPVALLRSIRNLDFDVAACISTSILFRLLIVVSTGLMTLSEQRVPRQGLPMSTTSSFTNNKSPLQNIGDMPYKTLVGMQTLNLSSPPGTNDKYAFQTFEGFSEYPNSILTGQVDAFSSSLDCQSARMENEEFVWWIPYATPASVPPQLGSWQRFISEECTVDLNITDVTLFYDGWDGYFDYLGTKGQHQWSYVFQNVSCNNSLLSEDQRIAIAIVESVQTQEYDYNANTSQWPECCLQAEVYMNITRSAQLLCKPTYQIQKAHLSMNTTETFNGTSAELQILKDTEPWTLPDVHPWDIALAERSTYGWAEHVVGPGGSSPTGSLGGGPTVQLGYGVEPVLTYSIPAQWIFAIRQNEALNHTNPHYLNETLLNAVANEYWGVYTALIAKQYMLNGPQTPLTGTVTILQQRLVVHQLSVRLMDGFLGLMSLLAAWVLYSVRNSKCAPREPSSLQGFAILLAASLAFVEVARSWVFFQKEKYTVQDLDHQAFSTEIEMIGNTASFKIVPLVSDQSPRKVPRIQKPGDVSVSWWQPMPLRWYCWLAMLLIFAGVVIALEILLHVSNKNSGLGSVYDQDWLHYTWTIVPATVTALLAMYVNAFDFNLKCLAPFYKLHQESTFDQSIRLKPLDQVAAFAMIEGFRVRLPAVFLSTLAGFTGAFLTIIVSGIFSLSPVPYTAQTTVLGTSSFNASISSDLGYFGNGMAIADLVLYNNYSQPTWTYQDLAFPGIATDNNLQRYNLRSSHAASISTVVPAIRSRLDCKLYPSLDTLCANLTWGEYETESRTYLNPVAYALNQTVDQCSVEFDNSLEVQNDRYFAEMSENSYTSEGPYTYVWGRISDTKLVHFAAAICSEHIQQINTAASFKLPNYEIDATSPPEPIESTAKISSIPVLENRADFLANTGLSSDVIDYFFQAAVYGVDGVDLSHLGSPAGSEAVVARIKQLTGLYRAIQYSTDARIDVANPEVFNATLTDPQNTRLVQNAASTHVLVGLLVFIMLSITLASLLMKTSMLVPMNPCSIAAMTSFLADSNIIRRDVIPEGSEWLDDKELKRRGIMQGMLFGVDVPESLTKPVNNLRKKELTQGNVQYPSRFTIVARTRDNEAQHISQEAVVATVAPDPEGDNREGGEDPDGRAATATSVASDPDSDTGGDGEYPEGTVAVSSSGQYCGQDAARAAAPSSESIRPNFINNR
ncbi:hypothetical protein LTR06_007801 [Exophiala xenobiotica]|nr:hypothetical protein LTR06_007801 [Exophiala xenobiotica]